MEKIYLKEDRDDELVKKCIRIGMAKGKPLLQEELIFDLQFANVPFEIETGPFGAGTIDLASTICSTSEGTEQSILLEKAAKVNQEYFYSTLKSRMEEDSARQRPSIEGTFEDDQFKYKMTYLIKGNNTEGSLALFPELQSQLDKG